MRGLWLLQLKMNLLTVLICAILLALSAPAWAELSRDDASAAAQRITSGRVLSVGKAESGERPAWRVKVVTAQGDVRVILLDAASGRAL